MNLRKRMMSDLDQDIHDHIARETQDNIDRGMSPQEARYAALRKFGNVTLVREDTREVWILRWLADLWQDIRFGARMLRKNPGFTAVAVLTLALGIGSTTTVFSMVNGLILRKPHVSDPNHLVIVNSTNLAEASGSNLSTVSAPDYLDWRGQATDFSGMAAGSFGNYTVSGATTPEFVPGARASAEFFQLLGVRPILGRTILPGDDRPGDDHIVLLSEEFWKGKFGGDRNVLGRIIKINGNPYTIAGVVPDRFLLWVFDAKVWMPLVFSREELDPARRSSRFLRVFARLKPGAGLNQAGSEMNAIAQRISQAHADTDKDWGASVMTLQQYGIVDSNAEMALVFLMAAVGFVLLIACANLAGLLLARNSSRTQEFSMRTVLGAGRIRLGRQLLTECLLISLAGGALGIVFALEGVRAVATNINWNAGSIALAKEIFVDPSVLIFTAAISILAALIFGIAPAFQISKSAPGKSLKEGARSLTSGRSGIRLQRLLVVGQIALSLILLVGAGFFVDGFIMEMHAKTGLNASSVLTASVSLRGLQYYGALSRQAEFFQGALRQVRNSPEVESAAIASDLPFNFPGSVHFTLEGHPVAKPNEQPSCGHFVVSPGYFETLQIPLLQGREFANSDAVNAAPVAIVDAAFAEKYFANQNAVGRRILMRSDKPSEQQWTEIVGVVTNVNEFLGQSQPRAHIFEPFPAHPSGSMYFAVRTRSDLGAFSSALRSAISAVDSDQAITNLKSMNQVIADSGQGDDVMAGLMGAFAVIALVMAAIGIYGVLSFLVARRTSEIGIRMALGATPSQVLGIVMRNGLVLIGAGLMIGLLISSTLPRVFRSAFTGFGFNAVAVFGLTFIVVFVIAVVACWVPARRAMRVDPMVALRNE
jgi:predicted permease